MGHRVKDVLGCEILPFSASIEALNRCSNKAFRLTNLKDLRYCNYFLKWQFCPHSSRT